MKMCNSFVLMVLLSFMVLMYQKYEKPVMKEAKKTMKKVMKKSNQMLEDMD